MRSPPSVPLSSRRPALSSFVQLCPALSSARGLADSKPSKPHFRFPRSRLHNNAPLGPRPRGAVGVSRGSREAGERPLGKRKEESPRLVGVAALPSALPTPHHATLPATLAVAIRPTQPWRLAARQSHPRASDRPPRRVSLSLRAFPAPLPPAQHRPSPTRLIFIYPRRAWETLLTMDLVRPSRADDCRARLHSYDLKDDGRKDRRDAGVLFRMGRAWLEAPRNQANDSRLIDSCPPVFCMIFLRDPRPPHVVLSALTYTARLNGRRLALHERPSS
jgi:hypothetical protein